MANKPNPIIKPIQKVRTCIQISVMEISKIADDPIESPTLFRGQQWRWVD